MAEIRGHSLAKLTRPVLHRAVARERLFVQLDSARTDKPAICVVGPPGAGKTTLVASWLDARKIPGIWYQVDSGDSELSTFFYYLVESARPFARKGQQALPLLTPEYQHDVEGYARRFFRELFRRLPDGGSVVLDNYQEVAARERFHEIIAAAVAEIPSGQTLVAISRRDPPDCYARLIANECVGFVDWDELRLSREETLEIARARVPSIEAAEVERLYEQSGGWAAGLTLMLDSYRKNEVATGGVPTERESIFSYFAAQIFAQLSETTRSFLVATAIIPQVPVSLAAELTANPEAPAILDDLYRRHLFTHRRPGIEPTYWYHALFRSYLREQGQTLIGRDAMLDLARRAARLLEARGAFDEACQLFHEARDWPALKRLIERHAPDLLAQGRGQTLRDWVLCLPDGVLEDAPWVRYWFGTSWLSVEQREARAHLERAFGQFAAGGDSMGQALSAAGMIESYFFEWSDFHPMRRWVDTLDALLDKLHYSAYPGAERTIYTSLLVGMLYAVPGHRQLQSTVERVTEILDEEMDVNSKVATAMILLSYCNLACDMERGRIAVARSEPLVELPNVTPFNQMWWYLRLGYFHAIMGNYQAGHEALDRAASISEAHGLQGLRRTILLISSYQISSCAMLGDTRSARKWYERMVNAADPARPMDAWHVVQSRIHLACVDGDYRVVADGAASAIHLAKAAGMTYIEILCVEHEATGHAVLGNLKPLRKSLARLRSLMRGTCFAFLECQARFLEAYVELEHGDPARGREILRDALVLARQEGFAYQQMARYSCVTPVLLAEALGSDIERDYAREIIHRYQFRPPPIAPESWPWALRIRALGCFEIFLDGQKLEFSGKAPRKVLSVLKAIVSHGPDPVSAARLADALWPDDDGDAARKALDVSLVRLRKLLGRADAVLVRDERISLNRDLGWVDAWAFAEAAQCATREAIPCEHWLRSGTHAMDLYRGHFLPGDEEDRSVIVMRLKLRDLMARLVTHVGQKLEAAGEWERAIECYRRGIDTDELAEEFYQGLMRCHAATGRPAEGIAVFRRLRQTLSVVLGIAPSTASEHLLRLLRQDRSGPMS